MISDHSSKIEQRFVRYALFLLALICMLPFAPGLLQGGSFYFRDLGRYFLPIRLLAYEGFLRGEIRDFNPYLHEGVPLGLPTLAYPIDWLPILCPSPWGVSLLLALHVPLAALGQMQLLRRLGCGASAAFAGGLLFALSGFTLSSLNFYVYIQAIAWAPWIALGFLRFCAGESRAWIMATITLALSISTTGAEITAQTLLVAGALSIGRPLLAWTRRVAFILLTALGLTAPVWMSMQAMLADSTRGAGFPTTVVLAHSVHPLTLLQTLIAGFYGNPAHLVNEWWGANFFPKGFPYILSLYIGASGISLAIVGLCCGARWTRRMAILGALALWIAMGRWAGLTTIVDAIPALHQFRFPTKAFFTVHWVIALLAAAGIDALAAAAGRRAAKLLVAIGLLLGSGLCALLALPSLAPVFTRWFAGGFFPPEFSMPMRMDRLAFMCADAAQGGLLLLCVAIVAAAWLGGRIRTPIAQIACLGLLTADLLRANANLNALVSSSFFKHSPELAAFARQLPPTGRVFTCEPENSPAYWRARAARGADHEVWTFGVFRETLTPYYNLPLHVRSVLSQDLTAMVPRLAAPEATVNCAAYASFAETVRAAGTTHVLSLDPIDHPTLQPMATLAPRAIAPLAIHIYTVVAPRAFAQVVVPARAEPGAAADAQSETLAIDNQTWRSDPARGSVDALQIENDSLTVRVHTGDQACLVVRQNALPGWSARVDGRRVKVHAANGRYLAVRYEAGAREIRLDYDPPHRTLGLTVTLLTAIGMIVGLRWQRYSAGAAPDQEGRDRAQQDHEIEP